VELLFGQLRNIQSAFEEKDFLTALIYMSVISHYLEDIHQPFHSTINYDGQLTGNDGIHFRYEIFMIDRHWDKPDIDKIEKLEPIKLKDIRRFLIEILENSLSNVKPILDADTKATKIDPTFSTKYYESLWNDVKNITNERINRSVFNLARLLYSIWIEAGKPEFPESLQLISPDKLEIQRILFFTEEKTGTKTSVDSKKVYSSILVIILFFVSIFLLKK
jgi:hypothetical protein